MESQADPLCPIQERSLREMLGRKCAQAVERADKVAADDVPVII